MKKLFVLFIFIMLMSSLFSCSSNSTLYLTKQILTDKNGTVETIMYYNEDYVLKKTETKSNGSADSIAEFYYDDYGFLIKQEVVANSGLITEILYKNNEYGKVVEQRTLTTYNGTNSENIVSFDYIDANGSYIQTNINGTLEGRTLTVYLDEKGNTIKRIDSLGTEAFYEHEYEGDVLISTKTTINKTITKLKYEYDKNGNKIKETTYNSNDQVVFVQEFFYSADVNLVE